MSTIGLDRFVHDERVHHALILLGAGVLLHAMITWSWRAYMLLAKGNIGGFFSKVQSTLRDYRSGKFYKPFKPPHPIVIVSTKKEIAELSEASCLSQRAVYADMFGFKHTMNNLEHNTSDHKVIRTRLYKRLLQVNGPVHLNMLYTHLLARFDTSFRRELSNGRPLNGDISLPMAQTSRRLASRLMSLMFFGESLSSDEEFSNALLRYPQDMIKCMAAFQITPAALSPVVHAILTNRGKAMRHIQDRLYDCLGPGRSTWNEPEETKHLIILHNMAELTNDSDYWNPELLSQSLLGIWFAAAHQPWMNLNFILIELCKRKEWQATLRQELQQNAPLDFKRLEQLPLLDGFMKETARIAPLDTLAIRRKALEPYSFSSSPVSVPSGATVCVSAYNLMHDPQTYAEPDSFDPTRFLPRDEKSQQSKFSEVSETFPVWGYGSLACPGRFHASLVIKIVVSRLLLRYDLRLQDETARTRWSWETFTMPYGSTRLVLKELALEGSE